MFRPTPGSVVSQQPAPPAGREREGARTRLQPPGFKSPNRGLGHHGAETSFALSPRVRTRVHTHRFMQLAHACTHRFMQLAHVCTQIHAARTHARTHRFMPARSSQQCSREDFLFLLFARGHSPGLRSDEPGCAPVLAEAAGHPGPAMTLPGPVWERTGPLCDICFSRLTNLLSSVYHPFWIVNPLIYLNPFESISILCRHLG